jgi:hypothetical protein
MQAANLLIEVRGKETDLQAAKARYTKQSCGFGSPVWILTLYYIRISIIALYQCCGSRMLSTIVIFILPGSNNNNS